MLLDPSTTSETTISSFGCIDRACSHEIFASKRQDNPRTVSVCRSHFHPATARRKPPPKFHLVWRAVHRPTQLHPSCTRGIEIPTFCHISHLLLSHSSSFTFYPVPHSSTIHKKSRLCLVFKRRRSKVSKWRKSTLRRKLQLE